MPALIPADCARYFDHTLLDPCATHGDITRLCSEAKTYGFFSVMVHPVWVGACRQQLAETGVKVGTVVGFPLGQNTIGSKCFEAEQAIRDGAEEIDYVMNYGKVKEGDYDYVLQEMARVTALCHSFGVCCKVILETCVLTADEIRAVAQLALTARPDFIKTSTGFGSGGATVETVSLMKSVVQGSVKVKASGGIRTYEDCLAMIAAGADRLGCSRCAQIMKELTAG